MGNDGPAILQHLTGLAPVILVFARVIDRAVATRDPTKTPAKPCEADDLHRTHLLPHWVLVRK